MPRKRCALWIAILLATIPVVANADCADLALVLAVDASSSIDDAEFALEMRGSAAAFRDPLVQMALESTGVTDVAAVIWGDARRSPQTLAWRRLSSRSDANALALALESTSRRTNGETGLGAGMGAALDLLVGRCAARLVIDVSGDGRESWTPRPLPGPSVTQARIRADAMGVTVNGLAIQDVEPALAEYYRLAVATGSGSFVIEVANFAAFPSAMKRKLLREIRPPLLARNRRLSRQPSPG